MNESNHLIPFETPVIFSDGSAVFKHFADSYEIHERGYFILAPSGSGKTHFVSNQLDKHWLDGDELWTATNAHPAGPWWLEDLETINTIDQRCDVITAQAKKLGLWIIGASNYWLTPDAIVLPDWETHKEFIKEREMKNYDGGATSEHLTQVQLHREWIEGYVKKGVPKFSSVEEAADYLANQQ